MSAPVIETQEQAIELLERVVADAGQDYIYPTYATSCVYVKDGAPSCIVGKALALAGIDLDLIAQLDGHNDEVVSAYAIPTYFPDLVSVEVAELLQVVQNHQDNGWTWGEALADAKALGDTI